MLDNVSSVLFELHEKWVDIGSVRNSIAFERPFQVRYLPHVMKLRSVVWRVTHVDRHPHAVKRKDKGKVIPVR
jgi:hypothetical protein